MTAIAEDASFWDRTAPKYAKRRIGDEAAYETTLTRTRAHLGETDRVLELGCGTGSTAILLAPAVAAYRATDISGGMIRIAETKTAPESLHFAIEGINTPAPDATPFDTVIAFNLLHLLPDLDGDLTRIREHLPKGGLFISKTPCFGRGAWHLTALIGALRLVGRAPSKVRMMNTDALETSIKNAGFEILETGSYPAKPPSRFVVARAL